MPWFGTIDLWALSRLAEYIVPDDIEWDQNESFIEESRDNKLKDLCESEQRYEGG